MSRLRRDAEKDRRAGTEAELAKQKVQAELKEAQREMETVRSTLQVEGVIFGAFGFCLIIAWFRFRRRLPCEVFHLVLSVFEAL